MTIMTGKNTNKYDDPYLSDGIELNSAADVEILPSNFNRIEYTVNNPSAHDIYIKEKAANSDPGLKGKVVWKRTSRDFNVDNAYTGPISARAVSGNPTITVVEPR